MLVARREKGFLGLKEKRVYLLGWNKHPRLSNNKLGLTQFPILLAETVVE
jgi:hypothetical protein